MERMKTLTCFNAERMRGLAYTSWKLMTNDEIALHINTHLFQWTRC
jgi:hypothetical protein